MFQFHLNDFDGPVDELQEALEELATEGKIRAYGWSTDHPDRAAAGFEALLKAAPGTSSAGFGSSSLERLLADSATLPHAETKPTPHAPLGFQLLGSHLRRDKGGHEQEKKKEGTA